MPTISGSMLYDLVKCPTRVHLDLFGVGVRDEVSPFVQLLWEQGAVHEAQVMADIGRPYEDLSGLPADERQRRTAEAMAAGAPLIYQGRIAHGDMVGDPDLLEKVGGSYLAIEIKSGAGIEGMDDSGKLKKTYAVQLGLYTEILEGLGCSAGRAPCVIDARCERVEYPLDDAQGTRTPQTWWGFYREVRDQARLIAAGQEVPLACSGADCKLCWWYSFCRADVQARDDLSRIPELGRSKRDVLAPHIATVQEMASADLESFCHGKKTDFPGIGPSTLEKFKTRAQLLRDPAARPLLVQPVSFPQAEVELFFDIEVDPFRDCCYLHGFIERRGRDNNTERFVSFFVDDPDGDEERGMFSAALEYMRSFPSLAIYYYSKYERTIYRKLRQKYPDVISEVDLERLFDPALAIDLYNDVVTKATEWPTQDRSIKTLASYLGFHWRDTNPSGAASIEWYDRFVKEPTNENRQRILDYNEDDCRATRVLLDGILAI